MNSKLLVLWLFVGALILSALIKPTIGLAAEPQLPTVITDVVKLETVKEEISYPGRVMSKVLAKVQSIIDGTVEKIYTQVGQDVKSTQSVLLIRNVDSSYSSMAVQSPVKGKINQFQVTVGSLVTRGATLFDVIDDKSLKLMIDVTPYDAAHLSLGQKAIFQLSGARVTSDQAKSPVEVLQARITAMSPQIDSATGTMAVELDLLNPTPQMMLGQLGKVTIPLSERQGILIPSSAVVFKNNESLVRIVKAGSVQFKPVELVRHDNGRLEIIKGLGNGDTIVTQSNSYLIPGQKVTVGNAKTPSDTVKL